MGQHTAAEVVVLYGKQESDSEEEGRGAVNYELPRVTAARRFRRLCLASRPPAQPSSVNSESLQYGVGKHLHGFQSAIV